MVFQKKISSTVVYRNEEEREGKESTYVLVLVLNHKQRKKCEKKK